MATKQEMEALWADLSRRLGDDPRLVEVMQQLDNALDKAVEDEPRHRLKVPYANATSMDKGVSWN
jgi:hypothetical protein